jgi:hypothetical protein
MLSFNKYRQKSILFIGPGESKQYIDMEKAMGDSDYTASLNDGILDYLTDFYFVGEKFIYDYVEKKAVSSFFDTTEKIFLGLHKAHKTRIDREYFDNKQNNKTFHFVKSISALKEVYSYNLDLIRSFNKKNMRVLSNLLNHFPCKKWEYIRARTLANSLQILYNLGFEEVRLIGFMDSFKFTRQNYENQKGYIKEARKKIKVASPQDRNETELKTSFEYQAQILKTVDYVYKLNKRRIYNMCPKEKSPQNILDYK